MNRPELLAPVGNMECFLAAINAGADAVYLAGKKFGARASADNFTEDELIQVLDLAHLHGKKVYLTLNTLIKEREWHELDSFLEPLYSHKLDGIIIQDTGLIRYLKENFPSLPIHISTQMTVTGIYGAKLLKDMGAVRIVPARELSIEEIRNIKEKVGIEVETFIHGAMCYCYSGQCLFSSSLGDRSGNRGRCAGPCRLPYTVIHENESIKKDNVKYPLSLTDMCTISIIDKLIDAGIDSFKIEGRLKSPNYVAGVTSIYRKYIDMYLETHKLNIDKNDINILNKLYIRTRLSTGYYEIHNSASLITADNPSYCENDNDINQKINARYVHDISKIPVHGHVTLVLNEPSTMILKYQDSIICVNGETVQPSINKPISVEDVSRQIRKCGNQPFEFSSLDIELDDGCFMPVKHLNELRRMAFEKLKEVLTNEI